MLSAVLLSSLLLSATPAQDLAEARAAEADLDYQRAKILLVGLLDRKDMSDRERLEAHYLAGQIERILGNDTEARLHFLTVLSTQPEWTLAPDTPPKVRTFFELVRAEVKERRRAEEEAERRRLAAEKTPPPPAPTPAPDSAGPPLVGTLVAEPVRAEITAKESQRYAQAVGDLDPVYFDIDAARAAGHPTLLAPPTFVTHAVVVGLPLDRIRTDGLFTGAMSMRLRVQRTMFGGEEWDFDAPVYVGDTITAETRLASIDEKAGSKGPFVRIVRETTFTNQHGDVVARSRQIGIAR